MAKTYRVNFEHNFVIKTTDINEVLLNYEFPDFCSCTSIVGEAEFDSSLVGYTEVSPCNCDQCECDENDDYTEDGWTCEKCFRDCVVTEG
jgi:hypothetical protein